MWLDKYLFIRRYCQDTLNSQLRNKKIQIFQVSWFMQEPHAKFWIFSEIIHYNCHFYVFQPFYGQSIANVSTTGLRAKCTRACEKYKKVMMIIIVFFLTNLISSSCCILSFWMLFMVTTMTVMKKFAIYFLWREFVMTCIGKKGGQTDGETYYCFTTVR